jgi:hypothetical protein
LLVEGSNFGVDFLSILESSTATSILLLLNQALDLGFVALEGSLLSRVGTLVLALLCANILEFGDDLAVAIVGIFLATTNGILELLLGSLLDGVSVDPEAGCTRLTNLSCESLCFFSASARSDLYLASSGFSGLLLAVSAAGVPLSAMIVV